MRDPVDGLDRQPMLDSDDQRDGRRSLPGVRRKSQHSRHVARCKHRGPPVQMRLDIVSYETNGEGGKFRGADKVQDRRQILRSVLTISDGERSRPSSDGSLSRARRSGPAQPGIPVIGLTAPRGRRLVPEVGQRESRGRDIRAPFRDALPAVCLAPRWLSISSRAARLNSFSGSIPSLAVIRSRSSLNVLLGARYVSRIKRMSFSPAATVSGRHSARISKLQDLRELSARRPRGRPCWPAQSFPRYQSHSHAQSGRAVLNS